MNLLPEHIQDLRKSNLSDETIKLSKIESLNFSDIPKETGFDAGNIVSAYRIPYFDSDGKIRFSQYKIFPPIKNSEGHTIKYINPKGTQARPYILPKTWEIKNKQNKSLWITEGAKKVLKLIQHGEDSIGLNGVWNFKAGKNSELDQEKDLWGELKLFDWKGRTTYLAFDADLWTNSHVRKALYELALRLYSAGAIIKIITWELSEGKGIDDFLVYNEEHSENAENVLRNLKKNAARLDTFVQQDHTDDILRALAVIDFEPVKYEQFISVISKKLKLKEKTIKGEICKRREAEKKEKTNDYSEEEKARALELLKSPNLVELFLATCHTKYLGRENELILLKLACVSRKFKRGVNVILSGTSSVGKSELVKTVLDTIWYEDKEDFTSVSEKYFLYSKKPLDHKIVTFFEISGTGQTAYIVRTAITEGKIKHGTVIDHPQRGLTAVDMDKSTDGLVVISTFASGRLDYELSTRVVQVEIAHNETLARNILIHKANDHNKNSNAIPFKIWQIADRLLESFEVIVPYADALAKLFPTKEERFMRDFDKVLSLIRSSALLHQYQREKSDDGSIIATCEDYLIVYNLRSLISQSVSPISEPVFDFLRAIKEAGSETTREEIVKKTGKSEKTVMRYLHKARGEELIACEGKGKSQKIELIEIPELISPLPQPEKIFGNFDVQLSNFHESLDSLGKEPDNSVCPVMSNLSNVEPEHAKTGQTGQNGTNGLVQCKSNTGKELDQIGQRDTQKTGIFSSDVIAEFSEDEILEVN